MSSIAIDSILTGSLFMDKDLAWDGVGEIGEMCLYNEYSVEKSPVLNVEFRLRGIFDRCNFKLSDSGTKRWTVHYIPAESDKDGKLFGELFDDKQIELDGKSTNCLLVQIHQQEKGEAKVVDPLEDYIAIFFEKIPHTDTMALYAQTLYNHLEHTPNMCQQTYQTIGEGEIVISTPDAINSTDSPLADESSLSSPDFSKSIHPPLEDDSYMEHQQYLEETLERYEVSPTVVVTPDVTDDFVIKIFGGPKKTRDLIQEARLAHKERKQQQHKNKIAKKSPVRTPTKIAQTKKIDPYELKKELMKKIIKDEIERQGLPPNQNFFQQIYTSVKYNFRKRLKADEEVDQNKLLLVTKMYIEFVTNMDSIVAL